MENFIPTDEVPVHFTAAAVDYLIQALEASGQETVRIVAEESCSGVVYKMGWDEATEQDTVLPIQAMKIILGPTTVKLMKGTTIDYRKTSIGTEGFHFSNPNLASSGCSSCANKCGSHRSEDERGE